MNPTDADDYQRVSRLPFGSFGSDHDEYLQDDSQGRLKVVPADAIVTLPSERRTLPEVCAELGVRVVGKDAVVVEASDMPKVRSERGMQRFEAGASYADWDDDPEYFEERAREYLALAERLRVEQEEDPAASQVEALASLIACDWACYTGIDASAPESIARRLVAQGVRVNGVA